MNTKKAFIITLILSLLEGCSDKKNITHINEVQIPVLISAVEASQSLKEITLSGNIEGFKTVRL